MLQLASGERSEDAGWQLNVFQGRKYDREEIIQLMRGSDRVFSLCSAAENAATICICSGSVLTSYG